MRRLPCLGLLLHILHSGPTLAHRVETFGDGVSLLSVAATSHRTIREDINFTSQASNNITSQGSHTAATAEWAVRNHGQRWRRWCYILVALGVSVIVFELVHKQAAGVSFASPSDYEGPGFSSSAGGTTQGFKGLWRLTHLYFCDGDWPRCAKLLLSIVLALICFIVFVDLRMTQWTQEFYTSLVTRDPNDFWRCFWYFLQLAAAKITGEMYRGYVKGLLKVSWRVALTKTLQEKWLLGRAFCLQSFPRSAESPSVDNPDQRLQEDTKKFTDLGLDLGLTFSSSVVHLAIFLPAIYTLSPRMAFGLFPCPGWLFYVSLLYTLITSLVTHYVGQNLAAIQFALQKSDANFRHATVQVRDHAESISLSGSESAEHTRLAHLFHKVARVAYESFRVEKYVQLIMTFQEISAHLFVFAVLAPSYFGQSLELGTMMQITSTHSHIQRNLSWFMENYNKVAEFRATCARLTGFLDGVDQGVKEVCSTTISRICLEKAETGVPALSATGVRVTLPDGRNIWDGAKLEVKPGERVLLLGPDGCGKSTFLRAISGCWPAEGKAIFSGRLLVVPQRPFLPAGSLHEAVSYPEAPDSYAAKDVKAALLAVGLEVLAGTPLETEGDWSVVLSGGEKQRLAFAHAILKQPQLLLLDEATSAVGEEAGAELYATLASKLSPDAAIITVAHDADAKVGPAHNVHLEYNGTGQWREVFKAKK